MFFKNSFKKFLTVVLSTVCSLVFCIRLSSFASVWPDALKKYKNDPKVGYVMFVKYVDGSMAYCYLYSKKGEDGSFAWEVKNLGRAYVGKNGIGKTKEGDSKTPVGDYAFGAAFGIAENPGNYEPYIKIKEDTYACDCSGSPYYNTIIEDVTKTGHDCKGEHMIDYQKAYKYGVAIRYNPECLQEKGSNIFLHCYGEHKYTGGCVAVSADVMKYLIMNVKLDSARIIIDKE